jgi:hypothetical protein
VISTKLYGQQNYKENIMIGKPSVIKLEEAGYESAALGFSLSYNSTVERAKELMPKYAFSKVPGENKFLREIQTWFDIDMPRLIWPEFDQYKVGTTSLSESTVHTLKRHTLTLEDFIEGTDQRAINLINEKILLFQIGSIELTELKANLPEGFLQRRIWNMNYANLQNMVEQRKNHKVKLWEIFISSVLKQVNHPEFIVAT